MTMCVQEEERLKGERNQVNFTFHKGSVQAKKGKNVQKKGIKKKKTKQNGKCFFCRKAGHLKNDCAKYKAWLEKKGLGNLSSYVCHQFHLVDVPENT